MLGELKNREGFEMVVDQVTAMMMIFIWQKSQEHDYKKILRLSYDVIVY